MENGLSQNNVNSIVQDKDGFIWIATSNGINRFDGYSFKVYNNKNTSGIEDLEIELLYCDKANNLWAGWRELYQYNRHKDCFIKYENLLDTCIKNRQAIGNICSDRSGNIWIKYGSGIISLFDTAKKTFTNFYKIALDNDSVETINILSLSVDSNNILWAGIRNRLLRADLNEYSRNKKLRFESFEIYYGAIDNNVIICGNDSGNKLWLGNMLLCFDQAQKRIAYSASAISELSKFYNDKRYHVNIVLRDKLGYLWINTSNEGLFRYDAENKKLWHFDEDIMLTEYYNCLFIDRSGVLWVGSRNGLLSINLYGKKITRYNAKNNTHFRFPTNYMNVIFQDSQSRLWFGSEGKGVVMIDEAKGYKAEYSGKPQYPEHLLTSNLCYAIAEINGKILLGGSNLNLLDPVSGKIQYCNPDHFDHNGGISDWLIWCIHKGCRTGDIWVGTMNGFNRIKKGTFRENIPTAFPGYYRFTADIVRYKFSPSDRYTVWDIVEDSSGLIWLGRNKYFSVYNPSTNTYKDYITNPALQKTNKTTVNKIFIDSRGLNWIGTDGDGIYQFDLAKGKFIRHINESNGLAGDIVFGILEDNHGMLWISTNKGLTRFNPVNGSIRSYNSFDGFQNSGYVRGAYYKNKDGKLFFGGPNGVDAFYPEDINESPFPPVTAFSALYVYNKPVRIGDKINGDIILKKDINESESITFSYRNKVFSIEFTSLHFATPRQNKYQYRLEGFDTPGSEWNNTSASARTITYTNLSPGTYIFKVRASNNDGIWSQKIKSTQIIILPPFWKSWWFRSLIIFLLIFSAVFFYLNRIRQIKNKNLLLEQLVKDRTREIEQQKEELAHQADNLQEKNIQLEENKEKITAQARELQQSNQELMKLNATKDRLFSIIGHDLRNPFSGILKITEKLIEKKSTDVDEETKNSFSFIHNTSRESYALLENILDWSKTQTKNISVNPVIFDLCEIVNKTIDLFKANAGEKNIRLISEVKEHSFVYADKNMISTVIRNLVNNAIKFTYPGGSVTVSSRIKNGIIEITVADTGIGMNKETLNRLFRIENHPIEFGTSGESGSGLGLLISKEFVNENKGFLHVESEVGKGSRFIISLPVNDETTTLIADYKKQYHDSSADTDAAKMIKTLSAEVVKDSQSRLILIIEDNNTIRYNLKQLLEEKYSVKEARDGKEGLASAFELIPDLIISDVLMPHISGIELCEKLKTDTRTSHIPIILLTAQNTQKDKLVGIETGADDYVTKPYSNDLLTARIRNLLKNRDELRKRFGKDFYIKESDTVISSKEAGFLEKATSIVEQHLTDDEFSVEQLSINLNMSRRQLLRKLDGLINQSPNEFIRGIRLKTATRIFETTELSVAEVAIKVGFKESSYFIKCFREQYLLTPSEYIKVNRKI